MAKFRSKRLHHIKKKPNDTPIRGLSATSHGTMRANLDYARQAVADDVGPIPIIPYKDFIRTAMPKDLNSFDPEKIEEIKKELIKQNIIKTHIVVDEDGNEIERVERWTAYPKKPSQFAGDEAETFRAFETIYAQISTAARTLCTDRDNTLGEPAIARYEETANSNLLSEANNSSRCDAALIVEDEIYELSELDKNLQPRNPPSKPKGDNQKDASKEAADKQKEAVKKQKGGDADILQIMDEIRNMSLQEEDAAGTSELTVPQTPTKARIAKGLKESPDLANINRRERSRCAQTEDRVKKSQKADEEKPPPKPRELWGNVGVNIEYKKNDKPETNKANMNQCIWGGNHTLRNDPCRKFGFGMTVEDINMRVLKFTRAGVVVSETFNWFEDFYKMIEIFALFATASKTELGWDTTVTRVKVNQTIQYVYTLHGKQYVTYGKPLCDYRADVLLGRGTRVFEVYLRGTDPEDLSKHHALKDLWTREGAEEEGEFLENIRARMTTEERQHFLNPLDYELLTVYNPRTKKYAIDSTASALAVPPGPYKVYMVGYTPPKSNIKAAPGSTRAFSRGTTPNIDDSKIEVIDSATADHQVCHREHSRTLFRKVCIPLHEVYHLRIYFRGLLDATTALRALHRLGYIHRDVSTGNVLWCQERRVAILTDLEYKKGITDTFVSDDFCTGTFQFMPIDVHGKDALAKVAQIDPELRKELKKLFDFPVYPDDVEDRTGDPNKVEADDVKETTEIFDATKIKITDVDTDENRDVDADADENSDVDADDNDDVDLDENSDVDADDNDDVDSDENSDVDADDNTDIDENIDIDADDNTNVDENIDVDADDNANVDENVDVDADDNADIDSDDNDDVHRVDNPDLDTDDDDTDDDADLDADGNTIQHPLHLKDLGYDSGAENYATRFDSDDEEPIQGDESTSEQSSGFSKSSKMERLHNFRYTILHDFESILWMAIWGLIYHTIEGDDVSISDRMLLEQIRSASSIFPAEPRELPLDQYSILMRDGALEEALSTMPAKFKKAVHSVVVLRYIMVDAHMDYYKHSKQIPVITHDDAVRTTFYSAFRKAVCLVSEDKRHNFQLSYVSDALLDMAAEAGVLDEGSDAERREAAPLTKSKGKGRAVPGTKTGGNSKSKKGANLRVKFDTEATTVPAPSTSATADTSAEGKTKSNKKGGSSKNK